MCLISNTFFPKIAKTDIVCYKKVVIFEFFDGNIHFESPFRHSDYTKEVIETKVLKPSFESSFKGFIDHFKLSTMDSFFERIILWK